MRNFLLSSLFMISSAFADGALINPPGAWPEGGLVRTMASGGTYPDERFYDIPLNVSCFQGPGEWLNEDDVNALVDALNYWWNVEVGVNYRFFLANPITNYRVDGDTDATPAQISYLGDLNLGIMRDNAVNVVLGVPTDWAGSAFAYSTAYFFCGPWAKNSGRFIHINSIDEYFISSWTLYHESGHQILGANHPFVGYNTNDELGLSSTLSTAAEIEAYSRIDGPGTNANDTWGDGFSDTKFFPVISNWSDVGTHHGLQDFFANKKYSEIGNIVTNDARENAPVDLVLYSHFTDCETCYYDGLDKYPPIVDSLIADYYPEYSLDEIFSHIQQGNMINYDMIPGASAITEQQICSSYMNLQDMYDNELANIGPRSIQTYTPINVTETGPSFTFNRVTIDTKGYIGFPDFYMIHSRKTPRSKWSYNGVVRAESSAGVFPPFLTFTKTRNDIYYLVTPIDNQAGFTYEATAYEAQWENYLGVTFDHRYQTFGYRFREGR